MSQGSAGAPLRLGYKGQRNYLHGSDFFKSLNKWAQEEHGSAAFVSRLSFRQMARTSCVVTTEAPKVGLVGNGHLQAQGAEIPFWLMETGQPIENRYDYDEEAVVAPLALDISGRQAVLEMVTATPIEEIIAATKKLSNQVAPLAEGKWLFGQLQLDEPLLREGRVLRIVMRSLLASRFSINDIYYGEQLIGNIRFVVGSP